MSDSMRPLRSHPPFIEALASMERPLLGLLAGALFTALVQSSAATMGIAIALASEGLLTLPAGITIALGANIGTCATALLAALGKPPVAVRAAVIHLLFNVVGALLWLPLVPLLAGLAVRVSPASPELAGAARAAAEIPRQLANANTLFNVINTALFLPFTSLFARLAERLVREGPPSIHAVIEPRFLDEGALSVPTLALEQARRETARTGELAESMLESFAHAVRERDPERLVEIARLADQVSVLGAAILHYLGQLRRGLLSERDGRVVQELLEVLVGFESLAQLVARDLVAVAQQTGTLRPSAETAEMLRGLFESVRAAVVLAVQTVRDGDARAAEEVVAMRARVDDQVRGLLERQAARLRPDDPEYLTLARLQMSVVDKLGRAYELASSVARSVLSSSAERRA